jgi:hypothetical protein
MIRILVVLALSLALHFLPWLSPFKASHRI